MQNQLQFIGQPSFSRIEIAPHRFLHYLFEGPKDASVVLFDAGAFGIYADGWWLKEELKNDFCVCLYDRAGMGWSDPVPKDTLPNSQFHTEDMRLLMAALGVTDPYILVGHSMAGLRLHCYANLYPQDLRGMIFVDALAPNQINRTHIKPVGWGYKNFLQGAEQAVGKGLGKFIAPITPNMFKLSGVPRADKKRSYGSHSHFAAASAEVNAIELNASYYNMEAATYIPSAFFASTFINGHDKAMSLKAQQNTGYGVFHHAPRDSHTSILRGVTAKEIAQCVRDIYALSE